MNYEARRRLSGWSVETARQSDADWTGEFSLSLATDKQFMRHIDGVRSSSL